MKVRIDFDIDSGSTSIELHETCESCSGRGSPCGKCTGGQIISTVGKDNAVVKIVLALLAKHK